MAKLNARWYPRTIPERNVWHFNFKTQAEESGADHGLTPEQIAQIVLDWVVVKYFNDYELHLEKEMENWRKGRDAYLDGDLGVAKPEMPTFTIPVIDKDAMTAIAERTERYAEKIKASDDYTESVGAAYGIVSKPSPDKPVDEKKPAAKVSTGGQFKAIFKLSMQGMKAIQMQMTRDGDPVTHKTTHTEGDIVDETVPLVEGKPETREYRFYFLEKGKIVGESSDIYEVTVHP